MKKDNKEIVFVTHNKGKAKSAEKYFEGLKITTFDYDLEEPRSEDVKGIAKAKVLEAYEVVNKPCMALDAGFFIEELNGFPKAFVHFALDTIGVDGILKLMKGVTNRNCFFKECLAYYDGKEIKYFYGESKGILAAKKQGDDREEKWSDLWYIFKPNGFKVTLAQMTNEERQNRRSIDKSTNAIEMFAKWYKNKYLK